MEVHPNKEKRQDCADCLYPERSCSECINQGTPIEPQHGREPDKVKPLAQYLSKYLDNLETCGAYGVTGDTGDLEDTINKAFNAYESTEQVKIRIERV